MRTSMIFGKVQTSDLCFDITLGTIISQENLTSLGRKVIVASSVIFGSVQTSDLCFDIARINIRDVYSLIILVFQ